MTRRALVTGANGFIGGALAREWRSRGVEVVGTVRDAARLAGDAGDAGGARLVAVGALGPATDWRGALAGVEVVVHCAARVHVMADDAHDAAQAYHRANVEGTLALARQAADAGVRRLVYLSSVKVHGERTAPGRPFRPDSPMAPADPYGRSKAAAEAGLRELAARTGLEVVVIRPPLVYGPGVKANFATMARAVRRGRPLPFARLTANRRSLVALDNLVDLVIAAATHPAAAGQAFLPSDGDDCSTAELLRRTATALGTRPRLLPVPRALLAAGARVLGRGDLWQRLAGDLQVDSSNARALLGWTPPVTMAEGLRRAVAGLRDA